MKRMVTWCVGGVKPEIAANRKRRGRAASKGAGAGVWLAGESVSQRSTEGPDRRLVAGGPGRPAGVR